MVLRYYLDRRTGESRTARVHQIVTRPLPTVLIGVFGGIIVGMTSVGSGSLMIVLLLFLYPTIGANQLVGTDLSQAVPLTAAAALGALAFGHVEFGVTLSLIIGSVPAVLVGSLISSSVPDRYIRPVITFVVFASGLKYVGVGTEALGWILCAVMLAATTVWLVAAKPWLKPSPGTEPSTIEPQPNCSDEPLLMLNSQISSTHEPHHKAMGRGTELSGKQSAFTTASICGRCAPRATARKT